MDGWTDGWMDVRTDGRTDSPCSTGLCLLRFPPEPLPCSHNCHHYKIPEQGKGTDDHLLPLGDRFFLSLSLSVCLSFCLSLCLSLSLSVSLCLSVCLSLSL